MGLPLAVDGRVSLPVYHGEQGAPDRTARPGGAHADTCTLLRAPAPQVALIRVCLALHTTAGLFDASGYS